LNAENENNFKDSENYRTKLIGAENNLKFIPSLEAQVKNLVEEKNKFKDQLNETYYDIGKLKSDNKELDSKLAVIPNLEDIVSNLRGDNERAQTTITVLSQQNGEFKSRISLLETDLLQITLMEKKVEMVYANLDGANQKLQENEITRDSLIKTIHQREEEVRNSAIGFSGRESELTTIIRDLQTRNDLTNRQLEQAENAKKVLLEENSKLGNRVTECTSQLSMNKGIEIQIQTMSNDKKSLEKSVMGLSTELDGYRDKYLRQKMDFDRFMEDYDSMREKFDRLQIICDDHVEEIEKKAIAMSKMQMRMVCLMAELDRLTKGGHIVP